MRRRHRSLPRIDRQSNRPGPIARAGGRDAHGVDDVAHAHATRLDELFGARLEPRRVERVAGREPAAVVGQPLGAPGARTRLANALSSYATSSPKKNVACSRMSPNTRRRSPSASTMRADLRARVVADRVGDQTGALQERQHARDLVGDRHAAQVVELEREQLGRIEAGRRGVHALEREVLDHLRARHELGLVVERPAEQHQVVDDRVGQVADLLVEVDDDRVEGLGRDSAASSRRRSRCRAGAPWRSPGSSGRRRACAWTACAWSRARRRRGGGRTRAAGCPAPRR